MKILVKKKSKIKIKVRKDCVRSYLLIWNHYRTVSMFFLIPEEKVTPRIQRILRDANGNFINAEDDVIPNSTHTLRMGLSRWLAKYEVSNDRLVEKPLPIIVEVCYTGQIG